jgi:site-specific recombinase XerD
MARHKSKITQPGYRKGEPSPNKGKRFMVDVLKFEEIEAMKEQCNVGAMGLRNRGAMDCLYGTGVRIGEFCNLKVRDIDPETRGFRIYGTKTKRADRSVGCNEVAFASIRDWLDIREQLEIPGPYAFPCLSEHERGNPIKPAQLRQMIHRVAGKAGLEGPHTDRRVHPHAFRHTFAAELWREGVDLMLISKALGHSSIAVTQIYINHVAPFEVIDATANRMMIRRDVPDLGLAA